MKAAEDSRALRDRHDRRAQRLGDRLEKVVARLPAAATDLGAQAAVLVMSGVEVALIGTDDAGCRTGFDHRPH
jgi:hypothetical protein